MTKMVLTERFESALLYALNLHRNQYRKQTDVPYFSHLLGVTSLVLEDGGDEDEAIAALLHDAVEDQGGIKTLEKIRLKYGERVAAIVDGLTDSYVMPKPPWKQRKTEYIRHLSNASISVIRVSLADKLYNARSILRALLRGERNVWNRFNGGKEGTIWYYQSLLNEFRKVSNSPMVKELEITLNEVNKILDKEVSNFNADNNGQQ